MKEGEERRRRTEGIGSKEKKEQRKGRSNEKQIGNFEFDSLRVCLKERANCGGEMVEIKRTNVFEICRVKWRGLVRNDGQILF